MKGLEQKIGLLQRAMNYFREKRQGYLLAGCTSLAAIFAPGCEDAKNIKLVPVVVPVVVDDKAPDAGSSAGCTDAEYSEPEPPGPQVEEPSRPQVDRSYREPCGCVTNDAGSSEGERIVTENREEGIHRTSCYDPQAGKTRVTERVCVTAEGLPGRVAEICRDEVWRDEGQCTCVEGETKSEVLPDGLVGTYTCTAGKVDVVRMQPTGCAPGETRELDVPCIFEGSPAKLTQECTPEGTWDVPDCACEEGEVRIGNFSCSAVNGGYATKYCEGGVWREQCTHEQVCKRTDSLNLVFMYDTTGALGNEFNTTKQMTLEALHRFASEMNARVLEARIGFSLIDIRGDGVYAVENNVGYSVFSDSLRALNPSIGGNVSIGEALVDALKSREDGYVPQCMRDHAGRQQPLQLREGHTAYFLFTNANTQSCNPSEEGLLHNIRAYLEESNACAYQPEVCKTASLFVLTNISTLQTIHLFTTIARPLYGESNGCRQNDCSSLGVYLAGMRDNCFNE